MRAREGRHARYNADAPLLTVIWRNRTSSLRTERKKSDGLPPAGWHCAICGPKLFLIQAPIDKPTEAGATGTSREQGRPKALKVINRVGVVAGDL